MMLLNKKTFFMFNNIFKLLSFNTKTINDVIYHLRNNIKYILFFILKKSLYLRLFFNYNIFIFIVKFKPFISYNSYYFFISSLYNNYFFFIDKYFSFNFFSFSYDLYNLVNYSSFYNIYMYNNNDLFFIFNYNYFLYLYKIYIFFIFIWLYSLKYLNFYRIGSVSLPSKKKMLTVLRSPHKDKKSREQFNFIQIKRN